MSNLTTVPYNIYRDDATYRHELDRLFGGQTWHFLCLEAEIANSGDYRTSFIGETPVIVVRDAAGAVNAFENRCAHRGALLCLEDGGTAKVFSCVYHGWTYDTHGRLIGVSFRNGLNGKGGMPSSFDPAEHLPRAVRVETLHGLVFGTFDAATPPLSAYLGAEIVKRIGRVLGGRKLVVLGRFSQRLQNNWKLYAENVRDTYHASILHLFFTTFQLNRFAQRGGLYVDESGGHHISWMMAEERKTGESEYAKERIRSDSDFRLADPTLLEGFDEYHDDIDIQLLTVFPGLVVQQIRNAIAVRQIVPTGTKTMNLHWTYIGFATDTAEQRTVRLKQCNLVGPAGYISLEDGCIGGFVQRGIAGADSVQSIMLMGGTEAVGGESRVSEGSVRGFWKAYEAAMHQ